MSTPWKYTKLYSGIVNNINITVLKASQQDRKDITFLHIVDFNITMGTKYLIKLIF